MNSVRAPDDEYTARCSMVTLLNAKLAHSRDRPSARSGCGSNAIARPGADQRASQ